MSGKRISIRARRAVSGYLFILPFIIGFLCFMLLPLVDSFWMSLCRVDVTAGQGFQTTFIGLDNYIRAFTIDPEFNKLLSEEIGVMVTHTIAILVVSFVIAIVLNQEFKGRAFVRAIQGKEGVIPPMIGRFAPTPSGRLHLGNLLCAMLAYLSARSQGGQFLLRIEDVDIPRCPRALAQQAIDDLRFLGFRWDAPPLYQSERSGVYQDVLNRLRREGHVYPCFCTRAQLHATVAPNLGDTQFIYPGTCAHLTPEEAAERAKTRAPAMRLRVPDETITFTDRVFGAQAENLARDCGDFLLQRSDGLFGYQLAVVVDDALSGVTEVVRGRDILSATPRQIYLQHLLGYPQPAYAHIPLLMDAQGRRLAKRDRDLDLSALSKRFSPEEILGFLAWSAGIQPEMRPTTLDALIPLFSWDKIPRTDLRLPAEIFPEGAST